MYCLGLQLVVNKRYQVFKSVYQAEKAHLVVFIYYEMVAIKKVKIIIYILFDIFVYIYIYEKINCISVDKSMIEMYVVYRILKGKCFISCCIFIAILLLAWEICFVAWRKIHCRSIIKNFRYFVQKMHPCRIKYLDVFFNIFQQTPVHYILTNKTEK